MSVETASVHPERSGREADAQSKAARSRLAARFDCGLRPPLSVSGGDYVGLYTFGLLRIAFTGPVRVML